MFEEISDTNLWNSIQKIMDNEYAISCHHRLLLNEESECYCYWPIVQDCMERVRGVFDRSICSYDIFKQVCDRCNPMSVNGRSIVHRKDSCREFIRNQVNAYNNAAQHKRHNDMTMRLEAIIRFILEGVLSGHEDVLSFFCQYPSPDRMFPTSLASSSSKLASGCLVTDDLVSRNNIGLYRNIDKVLSTKDVLNRIAATVRDEGFSVKLTDCVEQVLRTSFKSTQCIHSKNITDCAQRPTFQKSNICCTMTAVDIYSHVADKFSEITIFTELSDFDQMTKRIKFVHELLPCRKYSVCTKEVKGACMQIFLDCSTSLISLVRFFVEGVLNSCNMMTMTNRQYRTIEIEDGQEFLLPCLKHTQGNKVCGEKKNKKDDHVCAPTGYINSNGVLVRYNGTNYMGYNNNYTKKWFSKKAHIYRGKMGGGVSKTTKTTT